MNWIDGKKCVICQAPGKIILERMVYKAHVSYQEFLGGKLVEKCGMVHEVFLSKDKEVFLWVLWNDGNRSAKKLSDVQILED